MKKHEWQFYAVLGTLWSWGIYLLIYNIAIGKLVEAIITVAILLILAGMVLPWRATTPKARTHHFIHFPKHRYFAFEGVRKDVPTRLCLQCFQFEPIEDTCSPYTPIPHSVVQELETIAREMIRRYLQDCSYLVCPICPSIMNEYINFPAILQTLSQLTTFRKDTLELLGAGHPVGFVCCDCFTAVKYDQGTMYSCRSRFYLRA